jgi:hypothetical protein
MSVEMGLVFGEDLAQVAGVHDENPVEELRSASAIGRRSPSPEDR